MIVPRSRLLLWFALVVLPFSVVGGVVPSAFWIAVACSGLLVVLMLADLVRARDLLAGVSVEGPPLVRISQERETVLMLRIRNESRLGRLIRLGLALPPSIASRQDEMLVTLPADAEWSRLAWPCTPGHRGRYRLEAVFVEADSPMAFWSIRRRLPVAMEIRVYPNLLRDRKNLSLMLLHRGTFGVHARRQVGKGREFEKLREYMPGDGYEDIHWKATARKGRPVTKVFQIERTQEIYVVIDASRLSAREDTLERFLNVALAMGLAAEQQGDLFGLVTFSDRVEKFLRARNGKAHYNACRDAIYTLEPRQVNPDFDEVCGFIRLQLRRRALVIFLTALDDPLLAEGFVRSVGLIASQHLVFVNMAQPEGAVPLFSQREVSDTAQIYEYLGGHIRWHSLQELGKVLQRRGVGFSIFHSEKLVAQVISQYLDIKKRQLL